MRKAVINTDKISNDFTINQKDCVFLFVWNYGEVNLDVTFNDFTRTVPPADPTSKLPIAPFVLDCKGFPFDAKIKVTFPIPGIKSALIDIASLIPESETC